MIYIYLIDACETYGFERVHLACVDAQKGRMSALHDLGLCSVEPEQAYLLIAAVRRASACNFITAALRAINKARGKLEQE